jgi:hypothetical protein
MARLEVFWTTEEMADWLSRLASQYEQRLLVFPPYPNVDKPVWLAPPFAPDALRNAFKMFMAPRADVDRYLIRQLRDVEQRLWGWLMIDGGGKYTEPFAMLEKTDFSGDGKAAASLLAWLKRHVLESGQFRKGCRVTNLPTKASGPVRALFSKAAAAELALGVVWVADRGSTQNRYQPESDSPQ